jgi:hypothetical protein
MKSKLLRVLLSVPFIELEPFTGVEVERRGHGRQGTERSAENQELDADRRRQGAWGNASLFVHDRVRIPRTCNETNRDKAYGDGSQAPPELSALRREERMAESCDWLQGKTTHGSTRFTNDRYRLGILVRRIALCLRRMVGGCWNAVKFG